MLYRKPWTKLASTLPLMTAQLAMSSANGRASRRTQLPKRKWHEVGSGGGDGPSLTVMQFNVLADGLSGMDEKKGGFTATPPDALHWSYRAPLLLEELTRHGTPDLILLEECDHYHDYFLPALQDLGYEGRFVEKLRSPCGLSLDPSLSDGCALFWRPESLDLIDCEELRYEALGEHNVIENGKANQLAILATFEPHGEDRDSRSRFVVAVTHLAAPKGGAGERARENQILQLLSRLERLALPSIVGCDLNGTPEQFPGTDYPSLCYAAVQAHPTGLESAYKQVLGSEPSFTTWKRRGIKELKMTIDYIFLGGGIMAERVLLPPAETDVGPERFPSWTYPSDHIALAATLRLPQRPPVTGSSPTADR